MSDAWRYAIWPDPRSRSSIALLFLGRLLQRSWPNKACLDVSPSVRTYVRPSICLQKVSPIRMIFGLLEEVDEWCSTVFHMARSKVKVKVKYSSSVFRSTPLSRCNKACLDVCLSVRTYVRPSVCPQKISPIRMTLVNVRSTTDLGYTATPWAVIDARAWYWGWFENRRVITST